ncbi:glycerophosphodiester phosphodiesterase [Kitasatospora sp. NPDC048239]|uniref:glycerophosphodiester phosphodiesterase n=1 Tax=Kitasatospora sp. NPDC048239 TaxID=3364046 RepID=UPI00371D3710
MTLAVAHRGDPRRIRENTLPSISSAVHAGADWVEVDVRVTRDGVPVLLHDDTLARLWRRRRRIGSLAHAELERVFAGGRHQVPSLPQAIALARECGVRLMLDLPGTVEADAAARTVRALDAYQQVVFAGDPCALVGVRAAAPGACIAMSWRSPLPPTAGLLHVVRPDWFNQYHRWLTRRIVGRWHRRGVRVCAWTVDRPASIAALASIGVDAIVSNEIRTLRRALAPPVRP